jgi:putative SOS response-associated peptidase YedK
VCGRFVLAAGIDRYAEWFGVDEINTEPLPPSWNVAPTDQVYGVVDVEGKRLLGSFRWGLLPHWVGRADAGHINARAETLLQKPAFRKAALTRRTLIPADGFYEWRRRDGSRTAHHITFHDGAPMAFAGIWSRWRAPDGGRLVTCAIVTGDPNPVVRPFHDRMPLALDPGVWDEWLDPMQRDPIAILDQLRPLPAENWVTWQVSDRVNSVRNNDPDLVAPV